LRTVASAGSTSLEQLSQRPAPVCERIEHAIVEAAESPLNLLAGAADGAVGVADAAGVLVEDRAETVGASLDGTERVARFGQQVSVDLQPG